MAAIRGWRTQQRRSQPERWAWSPTSLVLPSGTGSGRYRSLVPYAARTLSRPRTGQGYWFTVSHGGTPPARGTDSAPRPAASPREGCGHLRVFTYAPKTGALLARWAHSLRRYMPRFNVPVSDRVTRLARDPENHHAATGQGTVRHRRPRVAGPPILVAVPAPYRPEAVSPSADAPIPGLHCGSGASAVCHVRRVTR